MLQADLYVLGIEDLHAVDRLVEGAHARPRSRVHQPFDAELDGRRVHLRAVVEEHVVPELEGVEWAVRRHLPRLRRVTHELPVGRNVQKATSDVHRDPHHLVAGSGVEIEVGDLVAIGDAEGAPALRRLSVRGRYERDDDPGERCQRDEETGVEASWAHDVFSLCRASLTGKNREPRQRTDAATVWQAPYNGFPPSTMGPRARSQRPRPGPPPVVMRR